MATITKFAGAALLGLGLVSCAPIAHNYGEAHAYNKWAHTVNPSPEYDEDDAEPGDSGQRGAAKDLLHTIASRSVLMGSQLHAQGDVRSV